MVDGAGAGGCCGMLGAGAAIVGSGGGCDGAFAMLMDVAWLTADDGVGAGIGDRTGVEGICSVV